MKPTSNMNLMAWSVVVSKINRSIQKRGRQLWRPRSACKSGTTAAPGVVGWASHPAFSLALLARMPRTFRWAGDFSQGRGKRHAGRVRSLFYFLGSGLLLSIEALTANRLLLHPSSALAQGGVPLWTNTFPSGVALAIAVDSTGSVLVTGNSYNSNGTDIATIKYSNAGVPLYTNHWRDAQFAGSFNGGIAADRSGNVFVTATDTNGDYATIKYSNAGVPLWINRYDGPGNWADQAIAIVADSH